jgi:hypothetical protein
MVENTFARSLPHCSWYASAEGRYFMSEEQEDAVIGRVIREKKEAEQHLALLQAEARKFGETFSALGASLRASAEYVVFERQEVDVRYHSPHGNNRLYKAEEINAERVKTLTHEIRTALLRLATLTEEARKLGV